MTRVESPATDRRSGTRRSVVVVVIAVVLVGLGVAAYVVFFRSPASSLTAEQLNASPKQPAPSETVSIPGAGPVLDLAALKSRISDATTAAVGTAPTAVACPATVEVRAGASFTCTATLDGTELPYTVTLKDDRGTTEFQVRGWNVVRANEKALVDAATTNYPDMGWTATCADGKRVVVGGPGTTYTCTLLVTANPVQSEQHTVRIIDDVGGSTIIE